MKKILVATDGSETSNKALIEARKIGELRESKITIINIVNDVVIHPYLVTQDYSIKTNEGLVSLSKELLNEALKLFEGFSGEVEVKQRIGSAGREIIEEANEGGYDLLVMGNRGLGAISRAMLGSVSNKVLNHVKTDVLIVK